MVLVVPQAMPLSTVHQPLPPQVAEAVGPGGVWQREARPEAQAQCGASPGWQGGHSLQQVEEPPASAGGHAGGRAGPKPAAPAEGGCAARGPVAPGLPSGWLVPSRPPGVTRAHHPVAAALAMSESSVECFLVAAQGEPAPHGGSVSPRVLTLTGSFWGSVTLLMAVVPLGTLITSSCGFFYLALKPLC